MLLNYETFDDVTKARAHILCQLFIGRLLHFMPRLLA